MGLCAAPSNSIPIVKTSISDQSKLIYDQTATDVNIQQPNKSTLSDPLSVLVTGSFLDDIF